jgi:gas vesicle protein
MCIQGGFMPKHGEESRRIVREKVAEFNKIAKQKFDEFSKQLKHGAADSD